MINDENHFMSKTVAAYYTEEIQDWLYTIDFYSEEIEQLRDKLEAVIHRNSIKNIAEKVEIHLDALGTVTNIFMKIQDGIQRQQKMLSTDHSLVENNSIHGDVEQQQSVLRLNVQAAEKVFADVKYDCCYFLSKSIAK